MKGYRVAVDVGGTFTDLVAIGSDGSMQVAKVPSTPPDFYAGVIAAIAEITEDFAAVELFVHGTTAHLNAFLERKGARCALLTTRGFGDVYEMRRGARPEAYDLHFRYAPTLIPRRDIYEVDERVSGDGSVVQPLSEASLEPVLAQIRERGYESLAIVFLHSYRNPSHEQQAATYLRKHAPEVFVTPSSDVCREWREYERTSTVAVNAYISPILSRYLRRLRAALGERGFRRKVHLLQSHGGLIGAEKAESRGVLTLMSGPVGGNVGCRMLSREIAEPQLICVDMGGTSFDISLIIDGQPVIAAEKSLAGQPILAPTVDIHTIGAGGGSIARVDAGALRVGPQSAGALPGPACYGRGGTEPTVTDANLLLGRLDASRRFGGNIELRPDLALGVVAKLGGELKLSPQSMAEGILQVVNAQMANAIRTMTISRGIDPRDFALVAFGGAGPMHAVDLARELGIHRVIVPSAAGAFSARGMLDTDIRYDLAQTYVAPLRDLDVAELSERFAPLERELSELLDEEGVLTPAVRFHRSLDMRYVGQAHFINVPLPDGETVDIPATRARFDALYERIYGHKNIAEDVEVVNLRAQAVGPLTTDTVTVHPGTPAGPARLDRRATQGADFREVVFDSKVHRTRLLERETLEPGQTYPGPLIINEASCTTVVPPGCRVSLLAGRHLLVELPEAAR